jgi:hypothetical protein
VIRFIVTVLLAFMCVFAGKNLFMAYLLAESALYQIYGAIMGVTLVTGIGFLGLLWRK